MISTNLGLHRKSLNYISQIRQAQRTDKLYKLKEQIRSIEPVIEEFENECYEGSKTFKKIITSPTHRQRKLKKSEHLTESRGNRRENGRKRYLKKDTNQL